MSSDEGHSRGGESADLVRNLSLFDITMVGVGAMIGAGIFVLTGIAAGTAGPALILAFALNGIVTVFTAMAYAELGSAIPEAGGGYLWIKEGLPAWNAFIAGWMSWFAHAVAGSLYALGFGAYLNLVLSNFGFHIFGLSPDLTEKLIAVLIAVLFVLINFKGVSETGMIGNFVTLGKIGILAIFIGSGMIAIFEHPEYMEKFTPFAPEGVSGILVAMGLTFVAFEGYEIIVQAGEEVENPRKNIPKAVFISLLIVLTVYLLVAFTSVGAIETGSSESTWQWLGKYAELGLVEGAHQFMPYGKLLLLVAGLLSTMSALNATTFSSTRVSFAMGRDRNLPDVFAKIHEGTRTPYIALFMSGVLIIVMAVTAPIEDVAAAASVMFLLLFLQVNIAVITIRKKYGDKLRYGYLMPFYPVLPVVSIALILAITVFMFHFSAFALGFIICWIFIGFIIYYFYASKREREKEREATPIIAEQSIPQDEERFRVLVPLANPESAETIVNVASQIAKPMDGEMLLLQIASVASQTPLRSASYQMPKIRTLMDKATDYAGERGVDARPLVRLAHQPSRGIINTAVERDVDFLVMGWSGKSKDPFTRIGSNIDEVIKNSSCNSVIVQRNVSIPSRKILIPVANPETAKLLLSVGRLLKSDDPQAQIIVHHAFPAGINPNEREKSAKRLEKELVEPAFFDPPESELSFADQGISFVFEETDDVVTSIAARTHQADLLIIGSSQMSWIRRKVLGETPYLIARRSACPVILVNPGTSSVKFSIQTFFQFFRELESDNHGNSNSR